MLDFGGAPVDADGDVGRFVHGVAQLGDESELILSVYGVTQDVEGLSGGLATTASIQGACVAGDGAIPVDVTAVKRITVVVASEGAATGTEVEGTGSSTATAAVIEYGGEFGLVVDLGEPGEVDLRFVEEVLAFVEELRC